VFLLSKNLDQVVNNRDGNGSSVVNPGSEYGSQNSGYGTDVDSVQKVETRNIHKLRLQRADFLTIYLDGPVVAYTPEFESRTFFSLFG
jgi:hypothetical protein